jgi:lipoprotein-releasing system permease protein
VESYEYNGIMKVEFFIAKRTMSTNRGGYSGFIIKLATIATALGLAVMIISTSMITGFKHEISEKIFGFWGHIHLTDWDANRSIYKSTPISYDSSLVKQLTDIEAMRVEINTYHEGVRVFDEIQTNGGVAYMHSFAVLAAVMESKNEHEGIILKGLGADFDWNRFSKYIKKGVPLDYTKDTLGQKQILISEQTAIRMSLDIGDRLRINKIQDGRQKSRVMKVVGLYKTGLEEYDKKFALVNISTIQDFNVWDIDKIGGYEIFIEDIDDLPVLTFEVNGQLLSNQSGLHADSIRDKFPRIFEWLDLQDVNKRVILGLMLLVGIINMITALLILILERTKMIGVLKSLGYADSRVRHIFLFFSGNILVKGIIWGNIVGLGFCLLQKYTGFIRLSEADYYLATAPVQIPMLEVLGLNVLCILVTMLFLVLPTYLVSRIRPVDTLRFN